MRQTDGSSGACAHNASAFSRRFAPAFCVLLLFACLAPLSAAQAQFRTVDRAVIEARLRGFSRKNLEREATLKSMFELSGCKDDKLSEQPVIHQKQPNLVCLLPGQTDKVIIVGAHVDKVMYGDGVADNWSGAALLPSLYYSLAGQQRQHTFLFIGFSAEEQMLAGSRDYVAKLTPEQKSRIVAMVNMDTLGLGPTEVWESHADQQLVSAIAGVARAMKIPLTGMNVDNVGTTDSEPFAKAGIPSITIHSLTQQTLQILHSDRDMLSAVRLDDYYASYRLIAGYLAYLDQPEKVETASP